MAKVDPSEPVNRGMLDEAVDAILKGVDKLVTSVRGEIKSAFTSLREEMNSRFEKVELSQSHLKDQVKGLKTDSSKFPPPDCALFVSILQR